MTTGQIIHERRKALGLTLLQLAARVPKDDGAPISIQYLCHAEKDRRTITNPVLVARLSQALGIAPEVLAPIDTIAADSLERCAGCGSEAQILPPDPAPPGAFRAIRCTQWSCGAETPLLEKAAHAQRAWNAMMREARRHGK